MSGEYGSSAYGVAEYGGASSAASAYSATLRNAPVTPGTVRIYTDYGAVTDDGNGNLVGSGIGQIDYRTGEFSVLFDVQEPGFPVKADYLPQEGGCDAGACKTHKFRLIIEAGDNIGQNQIAVTDAFSRLVEKLNMTTPIHAKWEPLIVSESFEMNLVARFDIIAGDVIALDSTGIRMEWT